MRRLLRIPTALLVSGAIYQAAAWPWLNPKVKAGQITIAKLVILPARVSFERTGAKGHEGGTQETDHIADAFYNAVSAELSRRGVHVASNTHDGADDDAARYAIADLQSRYDTIRVQLAKKPAGVEKGRYTLGDRVARFETGAEVDTLVFLRGQGYLPTPGRKAVAVATLNPFAAAPIFQGDLTFVDAKTGEVLVFLRFIRNRNMTEKTEDRFSETLRLALHDVPLPLPPGKR